MKPLTLEVLKGAVENAVALRCKPRTGVDYE